MELDTPFKKFLAFAAIVAIFFYVFPGSYRYKFNIILLILMVYLISLFFKSTGLTIYFSPLVLFFLLIFLFYFFGWYFIFSPVLVIFLLLLLFVF